MVIMTEKFGIPSQMPPGYAYQLKAVIKEKLPPEHQPTDIDKNFMTWSFVFGSLDPTKLTQENSMFLFALDPDAILQRDDVRVRAEPEGPGRGGVGRAGAGCIELVKQDKRNIVVGEDRLQMIGQEGRRRDQAVRAEPPGHRVRVPDRRGVPVRQPAGAGGGDAVRLPDRQAGRLPGADREGPPAGRPEPEPDLGADAEQGRLPAAGRESSTSRARSAPRRSRWRRSAPPSGRSWSRSRTSSGA